MPLVEIEVLGIGGLIEKVVGFQDARLAVTLGQRPYDNIFLRHPWGLDVATGQFFKVD